MLLNRALPLHGPLGAFYEATEDRMMQSGRSALGGDWGTAAPDRQRGQDVLKGTIIPRVLVSLVSYDGSGGEKGGVDTEDAGQTCRSRERDGVARAVTPFDSRNLTVTQAATLSRIAENEPKLQPLFPTELP